jgi:serine/threonine-protein phosphatase PGAM5
MERARETAVVIHEALVDVPLQQSALLSECTPPAFREFKDETAGEQAGCAKRLDNVFAKRVTPARGTERNDLIVAHANVIRYLVSKALGQEYSRLTLYVGYAYEPHLLQSAVGWCDEGTGWR